MNLLAYDGDMWLVHTETQEHEAEITKTTINKLKWKPMNIFKFQMLKQLECFSVL